MGSVMAKKKKPEDRSPKNKESKTGNIRTMGFRMTDEYADWLSLAAEKDHRSVAAIFEHAIARYAKEIPDLPPPPKRVP